MASVAQTYSTLTQDVPMVDDRLGDFSTLFIPVSHTSGPGNWGISDVEYVIPQTQEEHNDLLNTYYAQRKTNPQWKEMGEEEEKKAKHFNSKDGKPRTDLGAQSSVIDEIAYDPDDNSAWLQMNGKWYQYSATPDQFQTFLKSGSLGKEMNRIKKGDSMSLTKIEGGFTKPKQSSSTNTDSYTVTGLLRSLTK